MVLGIDFDNTLVSYDRLFHRVALEQGLIPPTLPAVKGAVRDHLRAAGQEDRWTATQGLVYGQRILEADPFPGALDFLADCTRRKAEVFIISHKTRQPYLGDSTDLQQAARGWLKKQGISGAGGLLADDRIFFEITREDKFGRIAACACTHFVDDLPEFLGDAAFPPGVERILFDPAGRHGDERRFQRATSWSEISKLPFP